MVARRFSGSNMAALKQKNRTAILAAIRQQQGMSRVALSEAIGLSRGGLTPLVDELIGLGLIRETSAEKTLSGRKPMKLELCPQRCYAVAVDWTRSHIQTALVDFGGNMTAITAEKIIPQQLGDEAISHMIQAVRALCKQQEAVIGIAVVAPGPLDSVRGVIECPPGFGGLHDIPVVEALRAEFSMPVFLDNNANAHAIAEKSFGYGREYAHLLHITVDEGIGGGLIVDGELFRGAMNRGSELGHITIQQNGAQCPCGNVGCAELYAAIPAMVADAAEQTGEHDLRWDALYPLLAKPEGVYKQIIDREAMHLSHMIVSAINLFTPQVVVLGSQITFAGEYLLQALQRIIGERCFHEGARRIPVFYSKLQGPSLLGGASLVFDAFREGALGCYEQVLEGMAHNEN